MTDYYNWMVSGWGEGLFCSAANGRQVDLVVIGTERHGPQRFTILLAQAMVAGGSPGLLRLDRRSWVGTGPTDVDYRAIRVKVERHAHRVGGALINCALSMSSPSRG